MTHLIATWGYAAVAVLVLVESFGIPVPGETALIVAGAYAGHSHRLSPWVLFVLAGSTAAIGSELGYALGRFGGHRLLRRWGPRFGLDEKRFRVVRYFFRVHGGKAVFLGRFLVIFRTSLGIAAGTGRMPLARFSVANLIGALSWAALITFLADTVGTALVHVAGTITWSLGGFALVVGVGALLWSRRRFDKFTRKAAVFSAGDD